MCICITVQYVLFPLFSRGVVEMTGAWWTWGGEVLTSAALFPRLHLLQLHLQDAESGLDGSSDSLLFPVQHGKSPRGRSAHTCLAVFSPLLPCFFQQHLAANPVPIGRQVPGWCGRKGEGARGVNLHAILICRGRFPSIDLHPIFARLFYHFAHDLRGPIQHTLAIQCHHRA